MYLVKNTSLDRINSELVFFTYEYFCKKLEHEIKLNFSKYKIRPPLAIQLQNQVPIQMDRDSKYERRKID